VRERRTLAGMATWPATAHELTQRQQALGELTPEHWQPPTTVMRIGAGGPYRPALLSLRQGPLLEQAVRPLPITPEVLVVNATGRDHPRRAGLALHLGAVLGLPTVGVTTRPLVAQGARPPDARGATAPLLLDNEVVGYWVRTRQGLGRWPSMPPGRPTPRTRSRWCWPRPAVLGPQSPGAAPAPWLEPGGHTPAERGDTRADQPFAARPWVALGRWQGMCWRDGVAAGGQARSQLLVGWRCSHAGR
jgi:hypothetical protein